MKPRNAARPIILGAIYLAAHFAAVLVWPALGAGFAGAPRFSLGLGLGVVVVGGPWFSPLVLAANLVTTWAGTAGLVVKIVIPAAWALISLLGALGLRRVLGSTLGLTRLRELALFSGICLVAACAAAAFGAWAHGQSGDPDVLPRAHLFFLTFLAESLGVLLAAPVFVLWGLPLYEGRSVVPFGREDERTIWELAGQAVVLAIAVAVGLRTRDAGLASLLALVPLIWIGLRDGVHISSLATLLVLVIERSLPSSGVAVPGFEGAYGLIVTAVALGVGTVGTSYRRLLMALRERQAMLGGVLRGSRLGMWEWTPAGGMQFDDQWCSIFGYPQAEAPADEQAWRKLIHREDLAHVLWLRDAHWKGHAPSYEAEYRFQCGDGGFKHVLDRGVIVARDEDGRPARMAGTCLDLSARKQVEATLLRIAGIMDQATDFVGAADLQGNIFYANQALMRLRNDTDQAAAAKHHISEYYTEDSAKKVLRDGLQTALSQGQWSGEVELAEISGRRIPASQILMVHRDGEGTPLHLSFFARDLTQVRKAEAVERIVQHREYQARQYESLSRLAGGVAHDFNNLLTPILGNVGMAEIELPAGAAAHVYLKQVEAASLRAADLCESLQLYAGKGRGNLKASDLNTVVLNGETALRRLAGDRVRFSMELAEGLPVIAADAAKIGHAQEIVVQNAMETCGGRVANVRIRTFLENVQTESLADLFAAPEFRPGEHVVLEISDDCAGMSAATLERLLEPFFAMRPGQQGMGLAALLGIGMAHSGAVSVCSSPAVGNGFRLYFSPSDAVVRGAVAPPAVQEWRGAGTVLVIDDEETVRLVAINMLESLGFTALVARDGMEGIRVFRQHASTLRAVLLDLTMPHMDGEQTYAEMRRLDAEVPVVVMSGYSELEMEGRFKATDPAGFLRKPFTREMLRSVMHQVLVRHD